MPETKYGSLWSREKSVLALYLYCQIPFAKTKANNPEVIRLAKAIGRTPASVARKLGNFGAFDPLLAAQGISGLSHSGKGDKAVWDEFRHHWEGLVAESNRILAALPEDFPAADLENSNSSDSHVIARPSGPTTTNANVAIRLCQAFFRRTVLSSYESSCCICELEFPALLTASHILPWATSEEHRVTPDAQSAPGRVT